MKDCIIRHPVRREEGYIWDANNNMICEIRGWGWICELASGHHRIEERAEELQDEMGDFIATAINRKLVEDNV